ncbi:MAG: M23 family metallopeptidase, partial [Bacteroidota bacterium]
MSVILLNDTQIDIVAARLDQEGLRHEVLRLELLDHICCQVEGLMTEGLSFDLALDQSLAAFGADSPRKIESDIISTLNHPHILMQKLMLTGSVLTAVFMLFIFWVNAQDIPSLKPVDQPITSGFGERMHPMLKKKQHHTGVDIRADEGTPVYASADGTVDQAGV